MQQLEYALLHTMVSTPHYEEVVPAVPQVLVKSLPVRTSNLKCRMPEAAIYWKQCDDRVLEPVQRAALYFSHPASRCRVDKVGMVAVRI